MIIIAIIHLIISLIIFPQQYPDQKFDYIGNSLRAYGAVKSDSGAVVRVLHHYFP